MRWTVVLALGLFAACNGAESQTPSLVHPQPITDMPVEIDGTTIKSRHGTILLEESSDRAKAFVIFNGKSIGELDANSLNGFSDEHFRLGASDVFIAYQLAGGGCGTYQFISTHNQSSAEVSPSFYSCGDIIFSQVGDQISADAMDSEGNVTEQVSFIDFTLWLKPPSSNN